jgi:hypothetical protein
MVIYIQRGSSSILHLPCDDFYYVVGDDTDPPRIISAWGSADAAWLAAERMRGNVEYLTAAQCAARFGLDPSTWRAAAAAGRIVGATRQIPGMVAPGKRWYIPVSSAQKYADTHRSRVRKAAAIEDEE